MVDSETPPDPALAATATPDDGDFDSVLAAIAAAPPIRPALQPEPGDVIADGYRIERQLGAGGMGAVFLAHDLELDRRVALKLQSRPPANGDLSRWRREAKAMARLSHPNVVVVHEVGTHEQHIFIAMEYVEGTTAREWIETKPDWQEVVGVLVGAGRGLAAAHEVGIIHRDFKPENVMLGKDGRPRVADFGLARDSPAADPAAVGSALGDGHVTATGAVLGTPAYMSPEQFGGRTVGPAADQFAFCVTAYEALFGCRPFEGRTTAELATRVTSGETRPTPTGTGIPPALVKLVMQGLATDPDDRHASMTELVDGLDSIIRARRRKLWLTIGTSAAVIAAGGGYAIAYGLRTEPCEDVAEALGTAWGDERRASVSDPALIAAVDAYAAAWIEERRSACEATSVRGERSELELSLRMACLDRHAARLDGVTSEIAETPVAAEALPGLLPDLAQCRDVGALEIMANRMSRRSVRDTAAQDAVLNDGLRMVAQAQTRVLSGQPGAEELALRAQQKGEAYGLAELRHRALAIRADLAAKRGEPDVADDLRRQAIEMAASTGEHAAVADAIRLRAQQAIRASDLGAARAHLEYFDVFAAGVVDEEARELLERSVAHVRGQLALAEGDAKTAIAVLEPLLDHPELVPPIEVRNVLGRAYMDAGRKKDAVEILDVAITMRAEEGIADDPSLAVLLINTANAQMQLGDPDGAIEKLQRAKGIALSAEGDQRELLLLAVGNLGTAERHRGNLDRARELQEESLNLMRAVRGEAHPSLAYATDELGELARLRGDLDEAETLLRNSMDLRSPLGDDHPLIAETLTRLGRVFLDKGDNETAAEALGLAEGILADKGAPDDLAETRELLARAKRGAAATASR